MRWRDALHAAPGDSARERTHRSEATRHRGGGVRRGAQRQPDNRSSGLRPIARRHSHRRSLFDVLVHAVVPAELLRVVAGAHLEDDQTGRVCGRLALRERRGDTRRRDDVVVPDPAKHVVAHQVSPRDFDDGHAGVDPRARAEVRHHRRHLVLQGHRGEGDHLRVRHLHVERGEARSVRRRNARDRPRTRLRRRNGRRVHHARERGVGVRRPKRQRNLAAALRKNARRHRTDNVEAPLVVVQQLLSRVITSVERDVQLRRAGRVARHQARDLIRGDQRGSDARDGAHAARDVVRVEEERAVDDHHASARFRADQRVRPFHFGRRDVPERLKVRGVVQAVHGELEQSAARRARRGRLAAHEPGRDDVRHVLADGAVREQTVSPFFEARVRGEVVTLHGDDRPPD